MARHLITAKLLLPSSKGLVTNHSTAALHYLTKNVGCQGAAQNQNLKKHIEVPCKFSSGSSGSDNLAKKVHGQQVDRDCFESMLFDSLKDADGRVPVPKLIQGLTDVGLRLEDPPLRKMKEEIQAMCPSLICSNPNTPLLDMENFKRIVSKNPELIRKAFCDDMVIPNFGQFAKNLETIFESCRSNDCGCVANYIPKLARADPNAWGMSVFTVDGQRYSCGDKKALFSLQSCSKPLTYVTALNSHGDELVHSYIGVEASSQEAFDNITLNKKQKPHNPKLNTGAIVATSLIKPYECLSNRYEFLLSEFRKMSGYEHLEFDNTVYISEKYAADKNRAIAHFLKNKRCFPDCTNMEETLDLYYQMCALEANCESGSVIAATFANGGTCPSTNEKVFEPWYGRDALSLMLSCGMNKYSGQFAFTVGLPAKSGTSGGILLVVPNVLGICLYSPLLDEANNSVRGVHFIKELVKTFNFHMFDNLRTSRNLIDPCRRVDNAFLPYFEGFSKFSAASKGDIKLLQRLKLNGVDMNMPNQEGRTALHMAAAEGHCEAVRFLVEICKADARAKDKWNKTALDDAVAFCHVNCADYLKKHCCSS